MSKKQDFGYMIYTNGCKYEGTWVDDLREGKGTFLMTNGQKYKGSWHRDTIHGSGKLLTFEDDKPQLYIGMFANGKKDGKGRLIHQNGKSVEGVWKKDVLVFQNPPELQTIEMMQVAAKELVSFREADSHLSHSLVPQHNMIN